MGQGREPLPVVPPPLADERLSSWIARSADVYRVSPEEFQTHVGWARAAIELDVDPDPGDLARMAYGMHTSVDQLLAMTFHADPPRYRSLLRLNGRETCSACSDSLARAPRLRAWAFTFSFWCDRHHRLLQSSDMRGASLLGDEASAYRGAELLRRWAMGEDGGAVSVHSALLLLLSSLRRPAPPAPWELARLPPCRQGDPALRSRGFTQQVLSSVVPEFDLAVPIYDRCNPSRIADLPMARRAERYALAIGVARLLKNPINTAVHVLSASEEPCRAKLMAQLDSWPVTLRMAIIRSLAAGRKNGAGRRVKRKL